MGAASTGVERVAELGLTERESASPEAHDRIRAAADDGRAGAATAGA